MVKFHIVDGDADFFRDFEDFIDLYNQGTTMMDIIVLLGISKGKYYKYVDEGVVRGLIVRRGRGRLPKFL